MLRRSPSAAPLGSRTLALATGVMALLLVALALLQVHWVGEVSEAARVRLRRELEIAAGRVADDFDREVFRAFVAFQPQRSLDPMPSQVETDELASALADGWDRWYASALEPELIAAIYVMEPELGGGSHAGAVLLKLDPEERRLEPSDWPPALAELERRHPSDAGDRRSGSPRTRDSRGPILASAPALLVPMRRGRSVTPGREHLAPPPPTAGSIVVLLDRDVIARALLPALIELHLGPEPRDAEVWVFDRARRGEPVFATAPPRPARERRSDADSAVRPLFTLRVFPELRAQGFHRFFDADRPPLGGHDERRQLATRRLPGGPPESGQWTLVVARSEGSLDAAVSRLRRRNLGVGLAVVALLGATAALLLASARRVERLARREMELVAGITHELRTPLASIGSAADNLADGVVREADQVRRYGGLIKSETHRLGALVAQVLDFAGTAAERRRELRVQPVDVAAVLDRVLADHRFTIEELGFAVDRPRAPVAARALADPDALRRALDNVVGNALKYGEAGRWLGIDEEATGRGTIELRVSDRGPGIARADVHRVFEPFHRGSGVAGHLHGTGLGLSVTRSLLTAMGASIEIEESQPGRGTTFLVTLPQATSDDAATEAVPA